MDDVHVDVYRRDIILVLVLDSHEGVGVLYAVDEVGTSLYHALVDKFLEWLLLLRHSEVEEELVPEAGVYEVACGMLRAAYIEVDILPVAGILF